MKKNILNETLSLICLMLLLIVCACGDSDSPVPPTPSDPVTPPNGGGTTTGSVDVIFRVYPQSDWGERSMIHLTAEYGDWYITEIQGPRDYTRKTWLFINGKERISTLVTVEDKMICFQDYDLNDASTAEEAYYFIYDDKSGFTGYHCRVNEKDNTSEILEVFSLESSEETSSGVSRSQNDGMDDVRALMDQMFVNLGEKVDDWGTFFPPKISDICKVWTQLAIPMARMTIYSNDPEKLREIRQEYTVDLGEGELVEFFVKVVLPKYEDLLDNLKKAYIISKYNLGLLDWDENEYAEWLQSLEYSKVEDDVEELSVFSSSRRPQIIQLMSEVGQYTITAKVFNIGLTDAWASVEVTQNGYGGSYISEVGIKLTDIAGSQRFYKNDRFDGNIHLTDLNQNSLYSATPYIKSYGTTYYGNPVKFKTDVVFSVTPENITFGPEKGSRGVYVNLPNEDWTWEITDKPSWCKITKASTSFFVDVEASSTNRSGIITVTGKDKRNGEEESCTVSVTQISGYYLFSGKIKISLKDDDGDNYAEEYDYMAYVQENDGNFLLTYTGPVSNVIFINQDIRQQPQISDDAARITSYTHNITSNGFSIAGNLGGGVDGYHITGHFKVSVDLNKGTLSIDDMKRISDTEVWSEASATGTLSLTEVP